MRIRGQNPLHFISCTWHASYAECLHSLYKLQSLTGAEAVDKQSTIQRRNLYPPRMSVSFISTKSPIFRHVIVNHCDTDFLESLWIKVCCATHSKTWTPWEIDHTNWIHFKCGVLQEDSLHPLLFCSVLPLSVELKCGSDYVTGSPSKWEHKITHLFYMEFLKLYATHSENLKCSLDRVAEFTATGMKF